MNRINGAMNSLIQYVSAFNGLSNSKLVPLNFRRITSFKFNTIILFLMPRPLRIVHESMATFWTSIFHYLVVLTPVAF